MYKPGIKIC